MKIPLNMENSGAQSSKAAQAQVLGRDILAAKKGDWSAKNNLARTFMPLLQAIAEKRAPDAGQVNDYIEAGKAGLFAAAKKYRLSQGAEKFQVFAVDFIENSMDKVGTRGGFLSRLFGNA